jgi:hypothetical protein
MSGSGQIASIMKKQARKVWTVFNEKGKAVSRCRHEQLNNPDNVAVTTCKTTHIITSS